METIVITQIKNKKDVDSLVRYAKRLRAKVKRLKMIDLDKDEDYFAKLIDEGMESGEVSEEEIFKLLSK